MDSNSACDTNGGINRSLAKPTNPIIVYLLLQQAAWRSARINQFNFALTLLGSVALQGAQLAFISVILSAFETIGNWSVEEICLLYGLRLAAHGVCSTFFGQHMYSSHAVRNGDWDRFLMRPVNPLLQLLTRFFNPGSLGDVVLGGVVLFLAVSWLPTVSWSWSVASWLLLSTISGALAEAGLQIAISGLDFKIGASGYIKRSVDFTLNIFGAYPLSIFGMLTAWLLVFPIPLAFMAYLPVCALLGRSVEIGVPASFAYLSPLAGPIFFWLGITVFERLSRHYASPGA